LISFGALTSIAFAGPAASSGPAQPDTDGAVYAPTILQNTSGLSPGINANNTAAASSSTSAAALNLTTSGSNLSASNLTGGGNSSNAASGNTLAAAAPVNPPSAMELETEKIAEISQEKSAAETANNRETKIELGKKFDSSLLDDTVDITKPQIAPTNGKEKSNRPDSETEKSKDTSSGDR